jgi:hypothetical protein
MLRRLSSIAFVFAVSVLLACGHQVTPSPTFANSDLSGHITVKFETSGALDFTNVIYVIAIDTCGTGVPYPNAFLTGYASYSFSFLVGGGTGTTALPELEQYYLNNGSSGQITKLLVNNLNPSYVQFIPNYNGQNNEFAFTFLRSQLNNPEMVPLPCPDVTAGPSSSPSAFASGSPTASPTVAPGTSPTATTSASATGTPSASPSPTPSGVSDSTGVDVPPYLVNWTFNLMTFAPGTDTPLDSLGQYGPTDNTFSGIIVDTAILNEPSYARGTPYQVPQLQAAYITYGEVDNYP